MAGVGMPAALLLQEFGEYVMRAFNGNIAYQVGSSLMGGLRGEKQNWRDVDVRLILPDDVYAQYGFGDPERPHSNKAWCAMCLVWSHFGRHMTGLPIDFQIQQQSQANADFSSKNGEHPRGALFRFCDCQRPR